jgi:hypothetical protein
VLATLVQSGNHHFREGFLREGIMAKLTTDQYVALRAARLTHLTLTFAIMFSGSVANMALILAFGASAGTPARLALAALVVATAVYSILGVKSALDDLKSLSTDALDQLTGSAFGDYLARIPVAMFNGLTGILNLAIAATQLATIFSA